LRSHNLASAAEAGAKAPQQIELLWQRARGHAMNAVYPLWPLRRCGMISAFAGFEGMRVSNQFTVFEEGLGAIGCSVNTLSK